MAAYPETAPPLSGCNTFCDGRETGGGGLLVRVVAGADKRTGFDVASLSTRLYEAGPSH